ncbi:MAG: DUF389 domain-containing protein [Rhodospirillales bacterium]|nr:DUF389 domain-containing protein [Rhodospirillales bacterium]
MFDIDGIKRRLIYMRARAARYVLLPDLAGDTGKELRAQVEADGAATTGYMLMCGLSAGIATLGLLQGSPAVVIGAMLVSPLMSPIVALGFGFASIDGKRIRQAAKVVMIGAAIGIITAILLTWLSPIRNATSEIIARTEPTLLDLLVALLSGVAGGYAIVKRMGATAIGVAIATALMPPLATVGYGLATLQMEFAGGALLLFLTNLAAIAFAIATVARLSGAARPLHNVEKSPMYVLGGVAAFMALAMPLGLTLLRVSHEASARVATRDVLEEKLGLRGTGIAQLDVSWPLRGDPKVEAVVIAPSFRTDAQAVVQRALIERLGVTAEVNLQQVVAADYTSQTRAMVDAAMERTVAGIAKDVPPFSEIRAALGIPVQSIWTNRAERIVYVVPVAAPDWTLADYRDIEAEAAAKAGGWQVSIVPPVQTNLSIRQTAEFRDADTELAIWAIQHWGLSSVTMAVPIGNATRETAQAELDRLIVRFGSARIAVQGRVDVSQDQAVTITLFGPSPSQRRTQEAAAAQAE